MKKILLVLIGVSVLALADMSRDATGIVTDSVTTLQWQDDYSDNGDVIKIANWRGAINYCENELSLGGHNDWRLPNKNELLSIVDYNEYNHSINKDVFQNTSSYYYWSYWSSTTNADDTSRAWYVNFSGGRSYYYDGKTANNYVRCVRSGQ